MGRVASALSMSEVQERPGGELKLGLAENASAEDPRAFLSVGKDARHASNSHSNSRNRSEG